MYTHLLIATDGSEVAAKGLEQGLQLAAALKADVTLVTVSEPAQMADAGIVWGGSPTLLQEYRDRTHEAAQKILAAAGHRAAELGVPHHPVHVPDRYPAEAILETARERGCDLIVMATHGRRGLDRLLLGSQAQAVLTHSTIPVLVVR